MTLQHNIYAAIASLGLLASCSSDIFAPAYTVGEADNAIVLRAGISEGGAGVMTRATGSGVLTRAAGGYDDIDNANHAKHHTFAEGTKAALRIDGDWWKQGDDHATPISQTTTATIGAETATDSKHNTLTMSPQRYWDEYGTADPANTGTGKGREKGLSIYGAAVNGKTDAALEVSNWETMPWNVGTPTGSPLALSQTSGWSDKDLLISNNIKVGGLDDTYKFKEKASGKLLEFTHAMSKITVRLIASDGFPTTGVGTTATKFATTPEVKLTSNETGQSNIEWAYTSGNVNVETGAVTGQGNAAVITMHTQSTTDATYTVIYDALIVPGSTFSADDAVIARINADGNIYYVTSEKIRAAITTKYGSGNELGFATQPGVNYIITVNVKKTKIAVTATIKDWINVVADTETPKINVTATYGYTAGEASSTAFTNNYDLFRSKTKATGYDDDNTADGINPAARYTSSTWDKPIYWPDHQTHYFFRGVYPQVGTSASGASALAAEAVTTVAGNDVVAVANAAYTAATFPSDVAIAIPRKTDGTNDETCKESGHAATPGICATEGTVHLNFEYAMSKVELRLKSSATGDGHIAMTKDNTKVEIIGGYSKARIKLSDGLHDSYSDADKSLYALSNLSTPESGFLVTSRDAIVPQEISDGVKFRITVTTDNNRTPDDTSDDKTDVYECKIGAIKESTTSTAISEWKPGKHYIYVLDINKTAINTTATITDWVTVTASDTVWF